MITKFFWENISKLNFLLSLIPGLKNFNRISGSADILRVREENHPSAGYPNGVFFYISHPIQKYAEHSLLMQDGECWWWLNPDKLKAPTTATCARISSKALSGAAVENVEGGPGDRPVGPPWPGADTTTSTYTGGRSPYTISLGLSGCITSWSDLFPHSLRPFPSVRLALTPDS